MVPAIAAVAAATILVAAETRPSDEARIAAATRPTADFTRPEPYERRPAGAATVFKRVNADSFSHASANMSFERELNFKVGNAVFRKLWVSSPSSTRSSDGLGPLFNARSCQRCHLKDGRGHPPAPGEAAVSMFLRLSIPPRTAADRKALAERRLSVIPEPTYGAQLQNFSI
ncbi:MAG: di-heme oxidoredictase family protein, partial [Bauldia litoralis]